MCCLRGGKVDFLCVILMEGQRITLTHICVNRSFKNDINWAGAELVAGTSRHATQLASVAKAVNFSHTE